MGKGLSLIFTLGQLVLTGSLGDRCVDIPEDERVDCGWDGATQQDCLDQLCCYTNSPTPGSPTCFYQIGKSVISAAGVSGGLGYFEFNGKAYLLSNSTDKGDYDENVAACENVGYKLATLRYLEEFHGIRMALTLMTTYHGVEDIPWMIGGRLTTTASNNQFNHYYFNSTSGSQCARFASWVIGEGDTHLKPWNLYEKTCSQKVSRICQKDLATLTVHPQITEGSVEIDSDMCRLFQPASNSSVLLLEILSVSVQSSETSKHFILKYMVKGNTLCNNAELIFPVIVTNDNRCRTVKEACDWLETLPNEDYCYVKCACSNGSCRAVTKVDNSNSLGNSFFCPVQVG